MRWDQLFDDLAAQAADHDAGLLAAEVTERGRYESGRLGLFERLAVLGDRRLELRLQDGSLATGDLVDVGDGWLVLGDPAGVLLVPATALAAVRVPGTTTTPAPGARALVASAGHGLRVPLRRLARDRVTVHVAIAGGQAVTGTVDRVATDHLEIAEHPVDEPRRASGVRGTVLVAYAALLSLRPRAEDR